MNGGAPNKPLKKHIALKHSILMLSHVFKKQKIIFLQHSCIRHN